MLKEVLVDGAIGTAVGSGIGAAAGAGNKEGKFSAPIGDAISSGQPVLVTETRTERETAIAREVIQASVGDCKDISQV